MLDTISSYFAMFLFIAFTVLFCIVYQLVFRYWFYFNDRNVKFIRGIPLLGSTYKSVLGIEPAAISYRRCYEQFPHENFIGIYDFGGKPSYLIRSPDLVKQLLITDHDAFADHKFPIEVENDLFAHTLFGIRGSKWNELRSNVSPAILNSALQGMHSLMVKSSEQFIETLKETDKTAKMFDSRDLFQRYANDIIATTAFGIEMNSMRDVDNEFFKAGSSLSEFGYVDGLKFLANVNFPSIVKLLDIRVTDERDAKFIKKTVEENVRARKHQNITRNDIIDLLIKAQNGQIEHDDAEKKVDFGFATTVGLTNGKSDNKIDNTYLSDDDMVAQCLTFFLAGLNTVSGTACFMFHELALNPDIQEKLFIEVSSIKKELNGSPLTYEMIPKMKYLDMCVNEALRRWCPIPFLERTCNRPYVLENADGKVKLQAGDGIYVPTYALHMDDKYFKKPLKFYPERFNEENKSSIRIGTYLPFGIGPNGNCTGARFAILAVKTLAFHVVSEFYIDKSYKTQDPLKLKALPLLNDAQKGFWIELRRRQPDRTPYKSQVFT